MNTNITTSAVFPISVDRDLSGDRCRDERWENVRARIAAYPDFDPLGCAYDELDHPEEYDVFLVEVRHQGWVFYAKQYVHSTLLADSNSRMYGLVLDRMVETIDHHIREKEALEKRARGFTTWRSETGF